MGVGGGGWTISIHLQFQYLYVLWFCVLLWYVLLYIKLNLNIENIHHANDVCSLFSVHLKYSFDFLWFRYCEPQNKEMGLKQQFCGKQQNWTSSLGQLYKFTSTQQSLRQDKKNWRPLNQYKLNPSRAGRLWGQTKQRPFTTPRKSPCYRASACVLAHVSNGNWCI